MSESQEFTQHPFPILTGLEHEASAVTRPGGPKILGQLFLEMGVLDQDALEKALSAQASDAPEPDPLTEAGHRRPAKSLSTPRLGQILLSKGWISDEDLARALSAQLAMPYRPKPLDILPQAGGLLGRDWAEHKRALPLELSSRAIILGMEDPLDIETLDEVQFRTGRRVSAVVVSSSALTDAIERAFAPELETLIRELPSAHRNSESGNQDTDTVLSTTPVVQIVDLLLRGGIDRGASDIHIEELSGEVNVRYRIDGLLSKAADLPRESHLALLSRIKVMAGLDISVKRRPQDGAIAYDHSGKSYALRVSTLPARGGEKCVLRILDPTKAPASLDELGLSSHDLGRLRGMLRGGQGVILAAGPTGSGKSSTLFGALGEVDREILNVTTLEDPVEYHLPGVAQVQVDTRAGLSFPAALRSVLRQDPDVVMVGEIRDRETAEIAMSAAVTGHLVLSTIHTTDAPSGIARLLNMGVPGYLVAGGLSGIIAQRLVRTLCRACDGRQPGNCDQCEGGYTGRTGIFQVLTMDDTMRDEVVRGGAVTSIRRIAEHGGMRELAEDARRKVSEGLTTPHEVARVIRMEPGGAMPCSGCGYSVPHRAIGCPSCGRSRLHLCRCGERIQRGWRYCAGCLAKVSPV